MRAFRQQKIIAMAMVMALLLDPFGRSLCRCCTAHSLGISGPDCNAAELDPDHHGSVSSEKRAGCCRRAESDAAQGSVQKSCCAKSHDSTGRRPSGVAAQVRAGSSCAAQSACCGKCSAAASTLVVVRSTPTSDHNLFGGFPATLSLDQPLTGPARLQLCLVDQHSCSLPVLDGPSFQSALCVWRK